MVPWHQPLLTKSPRSLTSSMLAKQPCKERQTCYIPTPSVTGLFMNALGLGSAPAKGFRSLKEPWPVLLLGKVPLLCIRFVLPQMCPHESPKAGRAWAASSPAQAAHCTEPFASPLRWAWVWTRPLRDNVIVCVLPEVPPCDGALVCSVCAHVWVLGVGRGKQSLS